MLNLWTAREHQYHANLIAVTKVRNDQAAAVRPCVPHAFPVDSRTNPDHRDRAMPGELGRRRVAPCAGPAGPEGSESSMVRARYEVRVSGWVSERVRSALSATDFQPVPRCCRTPPTLLPGPPAGARSPAGDEVATVGCVDPGPPAPEGTTRSAGRDGEGER
jgi:hypothetical protein